MGNTHVFVYLFSNRQRCDVLKVSMKLTFLRVFVILAVAALAVLAFYAVWRNQKQDPRLDAPVVSSFSECVEAGYPIQESFPRRCTTPSGQSFTEYIGNANEKQDLIQVTAPLPNQAINTPFVIQGQARGTWYFEASFPIELEDANGVVIGRSIAQAQSDWMTEDFVPFTSTLTFVMPTTTTGTLVLKKDNPSGMPERDDALRIPVTFTP